MVVQSFEIARTMLVYEKCHVEAVVRKFGKFDNVVMALTPEHATRRDILDRVKWRLRTDQSASSHSFAKNTSS